MIKCVIELRQVGGFSLGTSAFSIIKTDCHYITEILLKVALNTITLTPLEKRLLLHTAVPLNSCNNYKIFFLQVMILITGAHKAYALHKAIEEGINHMWTVSAFQQHPRTIFICDEDATLELKVKTVKYFKGLMDLHNQLIEEK